MEEEGQRLAGLRQAAVAAQKETEKGTEKGTEKAKHRHRSSSRKKDKDGAAK